MYDKLMPERKWLMRIQFSKDLNALKQVFYSIASLPSIFNDFAVYERKIHE